MQFSAEMSKYGGGNVHHFPNYHMLREPTQVKRFEKTLCRYLTRKIGFEAVLRIRCTKGDKSLFCLSVRRPNLRRLLFPPPFITHD
jgi:hypothetical protein